MKKIKQIAPVVPMVKRAERFSCYITPEAAKKIDYLCDSIPTKEWSGTMWYTIEGSIQDLPSMKVTVIDLYPLDIGTAGSTEYELGVEWVQYLHRNKHLTAPGVYKGHIHSHNVMATFFSGVDTQELADSAEDHNSMISLVVNNKRESSVAVTTKVRRTYEVKYKGKSSYTTFGGVTVNFDEQNEYTTEQKEDSYVDWAEGDVTRGAYQEETDPFKEQVKKLIADSNFYKAPSYGNLQKSWDSSSETYGSYGGSSWTSGTSSFSKKVEKFACRLITGNLKYEGDIYAALRAVGTKMDTILKLDMMATSEDALDSVFNDKEIETVYQIKAIYKDARSYVEKSIVKGHPRWDILQETFDDLIRRGY